MSPTNLAGRREGATRMHVFNLRRAQCALVASVALLGIAGCTDSNGGPGAFDGLVTALRDAHQTSEGTAPASGNAAGPAPAAVGLAGAVPSDVWWASRS